MIPSRSPRLLLVAYHFPPDSMIGAKRAARMASGLAARGWDVRVLTVRSGFFDRTDDTLNVGDGVRETRTLTLSPLVCGRRLRRALAHRDTAAPQRTGDATAPASSGVGAAKPEAPQSPRARTAKPRRRLWRRLVSTPDEHAFWVPPAVLGGLLHGPRPDVILATAPPFSAHVTAAILARLRGCRLALDYRDPWITAHRDGPGDSGRVPMPRLEAWCVRRAALTLATTESIAASLAHLQRGRVAVIPNGIDESVTTGLEPRRFARFTILYAGTFYGSRSAGPVLRALQRIKAAGRGVEGGVALHVMGIASEDVRVEAAALGVEDCLTTEEFQPYRRAMERMMGADLLLLVVGEEHGGMVPAKLFEYLAARRPILAIGPQGSEAGAVLAEAGAGAVLAPGDVEGIARRILETAAGGGAGAAALPERYTARATMDGLDRLLRDLL